jgi:hypothetical protein
MIAKFSPLRSQLMAAGQVGLATQAPTQGIALGLAGGGLTADLLQGYLRRQAATRGVQEIAAGATPRASNLGYRGLLGGALNPTENQ